MRKLLLISNSTNPGEAYLGWCRQHILEFFQKHGVKNILFIPYAGVFLASESIEASYDVYEQRVSAVFRELGLDIKSVHTQTDIYKSVSDAEGIIIGGGNTFYLVYMLHKTGLMDIIRSRVKEGIPFAGWSAGANVACPSMKTTNDMPIIEPESFHCLNLIPFQINPHYMDVNPQGHGGETRQQRIEEFLTVNRNMRVVGLRESTLLEIESPVKYESVLNIVFARGENGKIELKGNKPLVVFEFGKQPKEYNRNNNINFLLNA